MCFALKTLSDVLQTLKVLNKAFSPQSPSCKCSAAVQAICSTNAPTLNGGVQQGEGVDCLFSKVTLFEYNFSTILALIVV